MPEWLAMLLAATCAGYPAGYWAKGRIMRIRGRA